MRDLAGYAPRLTRLHAAEYYVSHATLRYRHPVDPALTALASYAIVCAVRALAR